VSKNKKTTKGGSKKSKNKKKGDDEDEKEDEEIRIEAESKKLDKNWPGQKSATQV